MNTITYKKLARGIVAFLDGEEVGTIRSVTGGFCYQPRGSKHFGKTFPTVNECKGSLA